MFKFVKIVTCASFIPTLLSGCIVLLNTNPPNYSNNSQVSKNNFVSQRMYVGKCNQCHSKQQIKRFQKANLIKFHHAQ